MPKSGKDPKIIFLMKLRKYLPTNLFFQIIFLSFKFLPLFMISHDLRIHTSNNINFFLSHFTLMRLFEISNESFIPQIILYFLIISLLILCYKLRNFYIDHTKKDSFNRANYSIKTDKVLRCLIVILVLFNQNFYEFLSSFFLCQNVLSYDGIATTNSYNNSDIKFQTECYTFYRYILIVTSLILISILILINYVFNLIYFQPWFSSEIKIPTGFNSKNYYWIFIPLIQGYLSVEFNLPENICIIARYTIRSLICLRYMFFIANIHSVIYTSKSVFNLILFIKSLNTISIVLEFFPWVVDELTDTKFVIIKVCLEIIFAILIVLFFERREKNLLTNFKNKGAKFYDVYNRHLLSLLGRENESILDSFFNTKYKPLTVNRNSESLKILFNQFFESKLSKRRKDYNNINNIFLKIHAGMESGISKNLMSKINNNEIFIDTKSFFAASSDYAKMDESSMELINNKLYPLFSYLDEVFLKNITEESTYNFNDLSRFKNILLYCLFCNYLKRNYVSAMFYLEKLVSNKHYSNNFLLRLQYAELKYLIFKSHKVNRINKFEMKSFLNKYYDNIKNFDILFENFKNCVFSIKETVMNIHQKHLTLQDFSNSLKEMMHKIKQVSFQENKVIQTVMQDFTITKENSNMISKYRIINRLLFGMNFKQFIELDIVPVESPGVINDFHNSMYMMLHLDEAENIMIDKVDRKLLNSLAYDIEDLINEDLLMLLPNKIAKYHKQITTKFTQSNKDFRTLNVFFLSKDDYALPVKMTCIIFPTFENRIIFFTLLKPYKNTKVRRNLKMAFTLFVKLSDIGEIKHFNREFEEYMGVSRDFINSPSGNFNFLTKILKLYPDEIFKKDEEVQTYKFTVNYKDIMKNLKSINIEEFKEFSFEAYMKFTKFINSSKVRLYEDLVLNVLIERRIIDPIDNEFFYTIYFTYDNLEGKETEEFIKFSSQRTNESTITKVNKEKKLIIVTNEIYRMSLLMLNEGKRLWKGLVKYSEFKNPYSFTNLYKSNKTQTLSNELTKLGSNMNETNNFNKNINLVDWSKYDKHHYANGWNIKNIKNNFSFKKFLIFLVPSSALILYFYFFFYQVVSKMNTSVQVFYITESVLNLKYAQIMLTFIVIQNLFKNISPIDNFNSTKLSKFDTGFYIKLMNDNLYNLNKELLNLNDNNFNKTNIQKYLYSKISYQTIYEDFSQYNQSFSIENAALYYRTNILNLNYTSDDFIDNYLNSNNPLALDKRKAKEIDYILYFILNNFADKINPLYDDILADLQNNLLIFSSTIRMYEIINLSILSFFNLYFAIYFFFYFNSGKNQIFKKYFINFNIIKFFTPYIMRKLDYLEEINNEYNKFNLENLDMVNFDLCSDDQRNPLIRFELENSSLVIYPLNRKPSNFSIYSNPGTTTSGSKFDKKSTQFYSFQNVIENLNNKNSDQFLINKLAASRNKNSMNKNSDNNISKNNLTLAQENKNLKSKKNFPLENKLSQNLQTNPNTSVQNTQQSAMQTHNFLITNSNESPIEDSYVYPKNILQGKASFYIDYYFIFFLLFLFFVLNIIFFVVIFRFIDNMIFLNSYTNSLISVSFSQYEIALIYIISIINKKEISKINYSDQFTIHESILDYKIHNYFNNKGVIINNLNSLWNKNFMTNVNTYQSVLFTSNSCNNILSYNNSSSNNSTCLGNSLLRDGLYLGFDTISNNLKHNYEDNIQLKNYTLDSDTINLLDSNRDIIQENVLNNMGLLKTFYDGLFAENLTNSNIYITVFYLMFLLLFCCFCLTLLFNYRSFSLIIKSENVLINLLR